MSTLIELMSRDPNDCDKADIVKIVEFYRSKRVQFQLGDMKAGSSKPSSKATSEAINAAKGVDVLL